MDRYLMGVNGELSYDELKSICQTEVPDGEYYNYQKIRKVILRKLNGEINDDYFRTWLIVVSWALNDDKYYDISWVFDGYSFEDKFDQKLVMEILATLKDLDYKLNNNEFIKQHKIDGLKVVYLRFEHCNFTNDSTVYKAYFVDYKNKRFDIRFVDDYLFDYDDNIMYCTIDSTETEEDFDGCETTVEPYRTPEEEQLIGFLFGEDENWIYDHNLKF